ncbi:MAG: hypothetical protein J1F64_04335, partial [Oscillospiraceae bacterium]|nr:hypothetical protein [Oscillospiraceae bacterium]
MKIIAFILSLSICMVSVSAYAQTGTDKKSEYYTYSSYKTGYGLPQEGYHLPELPDNAVLLDDIPEEELAEFNDLIYTALKDRAEKIPGIEKYFHLFGNDNKTMAPYYYRVITDHPELYYVKTSYSLSSTVYPDRKEISISPVYNPEFNEDSDKLFNDSVRKILWETVYDGMTDEEIALSVHDYLVDHITYYTDYASEDAPDSIYSAYGAVVNGSAVCQGYSLAYSLLMHMCGIDALYVESDEMNHGWNAIKLDDEWYHVDVTWDDCFERNYPGKLMAAHFYFLRSDEYFKNPPEDYTPHTVWDSDVPLCTSNKYNDQKYVFNEKY